MELVKKYVDFIIICVIVSLVACIAEYQLNAGMTIYAIAFGFSLAKHWIDRV